MGFFKQQASPVVISKALLTANVRGVTTIDVRRQPTNGAGASSGEMVIHTIPAFVVFISVLLSLTFIILIFSAFVGLSRGNLMLHVNPFAGYEALWPGQSIESVAAYGEQTVEGHIDCMTAFSLNTNYPGLEIDLYPTSSDPLDKSISCWWSPKEGVFHSFTLTIDAGRVEALNFFSDVLQADALFLYWGAPDAITRGNDQSMYLRWNRDTYIAQASVLMPEGVVKVITLMTKE